MSSNRDTDSSEAEILKLPKPGQNLGLDRTVEVEDFIISPRLTIKTIKPILQQYGLPVSGNREVLLERLRDFAKSPERWTGLFRPVVKRKRGDATGARASTHSAKRIAVQFGAEMEGTEFPSKSGTIKRKMRVVHAAEATDNNAWAELALGQERLHPDIQTSKTVTGTSLQVPVDNPSSIVVPSHQVNVAGMSVAADVYTQVGGPAFEDFNIRIRRMERQFAGMQNFQLGTTQKLDAILARQTQQYSTQHHLMPNVHANTVNNNEATSSASFPNNSHVTVTSTRSISLTGNDTATTSTELTESCNLVTVNLSDGPFTFDKTKVERPPAQRFSKDIEGLFRNWKSSNLLKIGERGIPVRDWDKIYKKKVGIYQKAWDVVRVQWGNWKFIAEEREKFVSDDLFWAKFSDEGVRFRYQQILDTLKEERRILNNRKASEAREYFGGNLGHDDAGGTFVYCKSNTTTVSSKNSSVARKWELYLAENPEVANRNRPSP